MNNPYQAPKSVVIEEPAGLKKGSVLKAVISGFAVDMLGTAGVSIVFEVAYQVYLINTGISQADIEAQLAAPSVTDPHVIFEIVLGLIISYLAGRLCCKVAGTNAKKAITILMAIMVILGLIVGSSIYSVWENILITALGAGVYYLSYRSFASANALTTHRR